jgi:hypothetical protein
MDRLRTRTSLRQLADQLACEYAGAVSPGTVLALVARTAHRLQRAGHHGDPMLRLTAASTRTELVGLVSRQPSGSRPGVHA